MRAVLLSGCTAILIGALTACGGAVTPDGIVRGDYDTWDGTGVSPNHDANDPAVSAGGGEPLTPGISGTGDDVVEIPESGGEYIPTDGSDTAGGGSGGGNSYDPPGEPGIEPPFLPLRARPQAAVVERNQSVTIVVVGETPVHEPLAFYVASPPQHGTLAAFESSLLNFATVVYTPHAGYVGPDQFTYVVSDNTYLSPPGLVAITVEAPEGDYAECCPRVRLDERQGFVVNGERVLPFGFWGLYSGTPDEGWDAYGGYASGITTGPATPANSNAMAAAGIHQQMQQGLTIDDSVPGQPIFDASAIAAAMCDLHILSWEVQHEPNAYPLGSPKEDVESQAAAIRAADGCNRPVFVTPSAGAAELFTEYAEYVDYVSIQTYTNPYLPVRRVTEKINEVRALIGDSKPFVSVFRVAGYQPGRYREIGREATADEIRCAVYQSLVAGTHGCWLFNYAKGASDRNAYGFPELLDAAYCVADSPDLLAKIEALGLELRERAPVFLSERLADVVPTGDPEVFAGIWDLNGLLEGGEYLVCVNAAQTPSPYWEYVSGDAVEQVRARVWDDEGQMFPITQCSDGKDNDGDGIIDMEDETCFGAEDETETELGELRGISMLAARLYVKTLYTGIRDSAVTLQTLEASFVSAPAGARCQYAVYSDSERDRTPHGKIYESPWLNIPAGGGWVAVQPAGGVTLEHTREYYMLIRVNVNDVIIESQDPRGGCRYIGPYGAFLSEFPPLYAGEAVPVELQLPPGAFRSYKLQRQAGAALEYGLVESDVIYDELQPYAVHVYQLERE
jgi:hypothetical protein